jgi:flavin-dependent dehydrogenase
MCDVPVAETCWDGFAQQRYDFNFLPVSQGLKGYLWAFPCLIAGVPHVNIGIYSLGDTQLTNADLRRLLADEIALLSTAEAQSPIPNPRFRAFPICGYHPKRALAAPHVVLAGDAAGAEPLMGEGISFALEYGKFAAQQILPALDRKRFDFADYTHTLAQSGMGKKLSRLSFTTKMFYGPTGPFWFALAARSRRLQSVGLKWYNGVDGWHQRSGWDAVRAVLRPCPPLSSRSLGT